MLTSNLVRFRKKGGEIKPRYLDAKAKHRLLPVAEAITETFREHIGKRLSELQEELRLLETEARDRLVVAGLIKLCEDRTELQTGGEIEPAELRAKVFGLSAKAHQQATPERPFDRSVVLAEVAQSLGLSAEQIDEQLYADLREAAQIVGVPALNGAALLERYDLSLAQAALLRAVKLTVVFRDSDPLRLREVFRSARFHGLIHQVRRIDDGYELVVDGPYSIFESVQKYGLKLGLFLPSLLALEHYDIRAEVLQGTEKKPTLMRIGPEDGLHHPSELSSGTRPLVSQLETAFRALGSEWEVQENNTILALPGQRAIIPDLLFLHRQTGEVVFLEVFGFWSRASVFARIEQIEQGLEGRLLLALSKKLRVSEEAIDDEHRASLLVFGASISAREVLARLEAVPAAAEVRS